MNITDSLLKATRACIAAGTFALATAALSSQAGLTIDVNGGAAITVNGGDALTFNWSATPDMTYLTRSWGVTFGTALPAATGSETVQAPNPSVTTSYAYSISGYDSSVTLQQTQVIVTVLPNPAAPAPTPVVWTPALGFYQQSTLSFYIVPDAVIGVPYSAAISATGKEPITFAAVGLPSGLSLAGNIISGTPTLDGLLDGGNFTLLATDADGFTSATLARMMTPVLEPRTLTPVAAPVVFDGGPAELNSGYSNDTSMGLERAASGFMLAKATTVTGVRVIGTYLGGIPSNPDSFTIYFYDRGPSPIVSWPSFPAAGRLIGSFTPVSVTRTPTGRASFGAPNSEFNFDLSFTGISLQANTLYYIAVVNTTERSNWNWMTSTIQNYPSWGAYSFDGGVSLPGGSFELAFQLKEGAIVVTPPPTPTTKTYKLDIKRNGKGIVAFTPAGTSSSGTVFTAGTVVTLTATPDIADKSSVWKGWTGDVVSQSRTITVTMSKAVSVTANFR